VFFDHVTILATLLRMSEKSIVVRWDWLTQKQQTMYC